MGWRSRELEFRMERACAMAGLQIARVRFTVNGKQVEPDDIAEVLGIEAIPMVLTMHPRTACQQRSERGGCAGP
jgi:hypothetical protein